MPRFRDAIYNPMVNGAPSLMPVQGSWGSLKQFHTALGGATLDLKGLDS